MGSDEKVGEVDLVLGKDGRPSEAVDVEGVSDGILALVVEGTGVVTRGVDSPMTGKGEPGDSFPESLVDDSGVVVSLDSFVLPVDGVDAVEENPFVGDLVP